MVSQDNLMHELRAQLHESSCPSCGSDGLGLILHCDYYPDGCLWLACCDSCKAQYHIDQSRVLDLAEMNRLRKATNERSSARGDMRRRA